MPELPPPPSLSSPASSDGHGAAWPPDWSALRAAFTSAARERAAPWFRGGGAVVVALLVGAVAWSLLSVRRGGGGGPPVELSLPRAGVRGVAPTSPASPGGAAADDASAGVLVHVAGAVARPGLYRLGPAPRVADALDAAGGPAPDADIDALNLAAKLADGDRLYVPRHGEAPPASAAGGASAGGATAEGPVDLNRATAEQLDALPGVGPATAAAIVRYRTDHGPFASVDDLLEVPGIGPAKLEALRPKVEVR